MQSQIVIKFSEVANVKKIKEKVAVKKEILEKLDNQYALLSDNKKMSRKARGISNDNMFEQTNWLPKHLRQPDLSILKNPHDIKDLS